MKYIFPFLVSLLFAQNSGNVGAIKKSAATGSIGTVTINGQVYNQLSLRPEIAIGKLGVGLDVYVYFNDKGMYWESWDFSSGDASYRTIIDKIYFLRWGQPGDNFYSMVGAIPSVTLGQGILVNNYANNMEYPQVRQLGLNLQAKVAGLGIEIIHSNFKTATPGLMGVRASYLVLPNLNIGASFATDQDQFAGLPNSDGDDYPDYYDYYPDTGDKWDNYSTDSIFYKDLHGFYNTNHSPITLEEFLNKLTVSKSNYSPENAKSDPISGVALDVTYALNEKIILYSQAGFLLGEINHKYYKGEDKKLGWGIVPVGTRAKLGPINLIAEYRMGFERFVFNYWERAYDVNRVSVDTAGVVTRESQLYLYGKLNGIYVQANIGLMNLFNLSMGYQNMQGEKWNVDRQMYKAGETNQGFLTSIGINPSLIPKVGRAEAFYLQNNVPNPFEFEYNTSTIWGYNVGIELSAGVMLVYQARTTYIADLDNPGNFKPVESMQIETQFIL